MKLSPIFALLATCAPVVSYAQTAATSDVAAVAALPLAPKSAETSDAFVWRFAPPVGSRWKMRSFTRAVSQTKTPAMGGQKAQNINFTMIQKLTADYDVLSRDALGATTIRLTLRDMTSDVTSVVDGKTIKSPLPKAVDPRAVDGATLTIKQSREGKIWGIVGMRAFQRKIFEASGIGDAATIDKILDASPMTNNSDMIKSMSMMAGTLPTSPVRLGESWDYNVSLPQPFSFEISGTRTLKALNSEVAVIADSADYNGGQAQLKMPPMAGVGSMNIDYGQLNGSVSGVSQVQRSSGLPLESTMNQTISGSIATQMSATNGRPAQKMTIPINVVSSARVVLEPR